MEGYHYRQIPTNSACIINLNCHDNNDKIIQHKNTTEKNNKVQASHLKKLHYSVCTNSVSIG